MIGSIISWSIRNRFIVLVISVVLIIWGFRSLQKTPIDAIPDLSANQVIVFTQWMGRGPQVIEDQVTFPLVTSLQGIPKVKDIRATSMFGMSFIYVIFDDDADIYWARDRVLERLNYASRSLPNGVVPTLGPDATGVGQVFWYTLDAPGYSLGDQRAIQDWYVKFGLQNVPGVSEVASFGGFRKDYQVTIDPVKLDYYHITLEQVVSSIRKNNRDVGGGIFEMNDAGYIVRGLGYIKSIRDLDNIAVSSSHSVPVLLKDIATVQMTGASRLGIVDENGMGEAVGGIVIMRYGENADAVIRAVKIKMKELEKGLPPGVHFKTAYDRSVLIEAAVGNVKHTLVEEIILVCIVILFFLFHLRSSLVVMITIPVAVLISFIVIQRMGFTSNIMSLSGIAIAIGVIVDNGIVMVENAHRHLTEEIDETIN
ncbi:MAG TPA: efflux RND transporter permease subunit [Chitinophagaceae bacterium]|nr:efflux RND transporter permease subunit [Chitinophagaceae bacterium]